MAPSVVSAEKLGASSFMRKLIFGGRLGASSFLGKLIFAFYAKPTFPAIATKGLIFVQEGSRKLSTAADLQCLNTGTQSPRREK